MTNLKKLLSETTRIIIDNNHNCECWTGLEDIDENWKKAEVENKDLLKACLPLLEEISEDEELDTMFCSELIGVIDFLKTLTK